MNSEGQLLIAPFDAQEIILPLCAAFELSFCTIHKLRVEQPRAFESSAFSTLY